MPSRRLREKLTKENLWIYILSLLKRKPMYGYELRDAVEKRFGFRPGNVTAYRVLYALNRAGLVAEVENTSSRDRKYYAATKTGLKELDAGKTILKEILSKL
jgi:PadR family transcriptional regulator, regulatory protein PadR